MSDEVRARLSLLFDRVEFDFCLFVLIASYATASGFGDCQGGDGSRKPTRRDEGD